MCLGSDTRRTSTILHPLSVNPQSFLGPRIHRVSLDVLKHVGGRQRLFYCDWWMVRRRGAPIPVRTTVQAFLLWMNHNTLSLWTYT